MLERVYKTKWISANLSYCQQAQLRLNEKMNCIMKFKADKFKSSNVGGTVR